LQGQLVGGEGNARAQVERLGKGQPGVHQGLVLLLVDAPVT